MAEKLSESYIRERVMLLRISAVRRTLRETNSIEIFRKNIKQAILEDEIGVYGKCEDEIRDGVEKWAFDCTRGLEDE